MNNNNKLDNVSNTLPRAKQILFGGTYKNLETAITKTAPKAFNRKIIPNRNKFDVIFYKI